MLLKLKTKPTQFDLSCLILGLLIVSINIREPFFHTREILFLLLIITSLKYLDLSKLKYALVLITIWSVTILYNIIVPGSNIDFTQGGFETLIAAAYLSLLCFAQRRYADSIIKSYVFVSVVVALITISVWIACFFSESLYWSLRSYFLNLKSQTDLSVMFIDYRAILGTRYLTVWYRTAPCMICSLGYCLIQRLEGRKKNTIYILLFVIALIFSGTRANFLSAILLVVFYFAFILYKKGFKIVTIVIFIIAVVSALVLAMSFLNDPGSRSSAIKVDDANTYLEMFRSDPLRTLFFGWGPGSSFYSVLRNKVMNISELSLFETVRRYGIVATCIIMFGIWLSPLRNSSFKKKGEYKLYYFLALAAYIATAFTNPYLIDSVGFCALLFYYTCFKYR